MPFQKGVSGNKSGRPRQTPEEKEERERFKTLLKSATVTALENIIQIANDRYSRDRFKANAYLIDKAYGNNAVFLSEDMEDIEPVVIRVVPYQKETENNEDENTDWEESPDEEDWEE